MTTNVYYGTLGGLALVSGTYHVFGNNGTTAFQGSVGSGNSALTNLVSSGSYPYQYITASQLYSDLTTASDHLPVVADYTIPISGPSLAVAPASGLTSTGGAGGPFSPASQVYTLTNTGAGSLNWTAGNSSNWLTLSATSGTLAAGVGTSVTVSINATANSLSAGSYSDTVSFTNTSNGAGNTTRAVSLTVTNTTPQLSVTPAPGLTSTGPAGGPFSPASQIYSLTNVGGANLNWTAANSSNWLTLSVTSGTLVPGAGTNVTVSFNANANSLAAGSYSDTVSFANLNNGSGNTTRAVGLTVTNTAPQLSVTPAPGLTSSGPAGGPFSPASQIYNLTNVGGANLNWTAANSSNWLTLSVTSGTLVPGAGTNVTVSFNVNANSLVAGSYSDTVSFANTSNGTGNTTRSVSLTVTNPVPVLSVSPAPGLTSSGSAGGPFSPASQIYTLTNTGGGRPELDGGQLLQLADPFRHQRHAGPGAGTNVTVSFNVNANSLVAGSYSDTVSFANPNNGSGNATRAVSLTVTNTIPVLSVSPASGLASGGPVGGPFSPASQTYGLTNTGTASLNWTATKTAAWLTLSATSGTLSPGVGTTITASVNANANNLSAGSYSDTIGFTNLNNGNGNTTRSASLSISSFGFYDDFSTFTAGNLVGQSSWVQYTNLSGSPLQVTDGKVIIPGGQTTDTQDAYKNFTQTNITVFYGLTLTVTSAVNSTSASYFTALYTSNAAAGYANFRLTAKAGDSHLTNFVLGVRVTGQSGDPYTFGTTTLTTGVQYRVIVQAPSGYASAALYVNPTSADLASQTVYANNPVGTGTAPTSLGSIVISQYGTTGVPTDGVSIGKVVVSDSFATVYNDLTGVVSPPVAGFSAGPASGTAPLSVSFTNLSTGATNYSWAFGDGHTSTLTNPANTYTNPGTYSVTLTAVGPGGTNALTQHQLHPRGLSAPGRRLLRRADQRDRTPLGLVHQPEHRRHQLRLGLRRRQHQHPHQRRQHLH